MSDPQTPLTPPERNVRLARLSGKATAAWLIFFLILIALLIPAVLRLDLWIDFEIVVAAWWLVWLAVLARLLYTGQRITADHQLPEPRNWLGAVTGKNDSAAKKSKKDPLDIKKRKSGNSSGGWWPYINVGPMDGEGCLYFLAAIVAFVVCVALIWFLIEIAIPVVLFLLYLTVRGMLAHVINDRHHCRGQIGRALAWALVWATVYTAPLAGMVWLIHFIHSSQASP
jgi:hypothetical protein